MATESSEEPQIDEELLGAMLKFDEMLRSGKLNTGIESSDDHRLGPASEVLRMARDALCELEAAVPRRADSIPSWVPTRIGRFEVHSVLGVGGFAIVYLAWDPVLSRFVALKIPRPHSLVDAQLRRRFVKEGKTSAQLDHPGIVPVFEAGEDGDVPYIACAWCEGPTLAKWLSERTSPVHPHTATTIIRQLAEAVQYSHDRNVLHRDIKPGNILLFPLRTSGLSEFPFCPRLADFGLARLMAQSQSDSVSGAMFGTPQFMAPEQLAHDAGSTSPATDVYALGAVLHNLVIGHPPFGAATITDTLRQIEELEAVPPHIVNPHISKDLSWIILKCLEKRPIDRYTTAADLAADLQRFLDGRPVQARRTAMFGRIQKWFRRRPLVASLSLIAVLLTSLLMALGFQYANAVHHLHGEVEDRQNQLSNAERRLEDAQLVARRSKRDAENLLYSANVLSAGLALRRSDPLDASLHLKPWILDARPHSEVRAEFAGRYIWNQLNFSSRTIAQTQFAVWDFALSPDGRLLAASGNTGKVLLFDVKRSFETAGEMFAVESEVNSLSFSKDGTLLVGSTDAGEVIVWDVQARTIRRRFSVFDQRQLYNAEFIADTHEIVVGGQSTDVFIYDADSGQLLETIAGVQDRTVESLAVAYDGRQIAVAGSQGVLMLISLDSERGNRDRRVVLQSGSPLNVVQFSDDAQVVYAGDSSGHITAVNVMTGELLAENQRPDGIQGLAVGRDGRIVFGDKQGVLAEFPRLDLDNPLRQEWIPSRVWSAHGRTINAIIAVEQPEQQDAELRTWISSDRSGVISLWVQEEGQKRQVLPIDSELPEQARMFGINSLIAGPKESQLYRLCDDHTELWDAGQASCIEPVLPGVQVAGMSADGLGNLKFAGTADGSLIEVRPDGSIVRSLEILPGSRVNRVSYAPGATVILAEVSGDDDVRWIDAASWKQIRTFSNRSCSLVSPFGWLAVASHGTNDIEVYSQSSSRLLATIDAHETTVHQLCAATSRPWMVSVSADRTAKLWDTRTWKIIHVFSGHAYPIHSGAISPDQQTLATGDESGTIKLWHLESGRELIEFSSVNRNVSALAFSQTGRYLFALKSDGAVVVFDSGP